MKPIATQVKQALNVAMSFGRAQIEEFQNRLSRKNDDTVEAQANTFRIWMWSSAAGLSLIVIASIVSMSGQDVHSKEISTAETSLLERLPEGYVIAPIEPINLDSLDSIFEEQGYADLYQAGANGERGRLIARGLPLIRAPRNPRRFAVIVSDEQGHILADLGEPVTVTLRKGPLKKPEDSARSKPLKTKHGGKSPLHEERRDRIDLIEEEMPAWPETAQFSLAHFNLAGDHS